MLTTNFMRLAAFGLTLLASSAFAELKVEAKLDKPAKVGDNFLAIHIVDENGAPIDGATIKIDVAMTSMDMGASHPRATGLGGGNYRATLAFSMAGLWRATITASAPNEKPATVRLDWQAKGGQGMAGMDMGQAMAGRLGPWPMQRESSGTSWIPESSPMYMKMLPKAGAFDLSLMGFLTFNESDAGGKRGDSRFYSNSMIMLMGSERAGGGTFGFSLMGSLDPVFNGEYGYPDLFQTGETAHGNRLTDYQHPHDLLDEVTVSYRHAVGKSLHSFVYGGPVGEPALGGPTFMHRPSGMDIPEAPISHHWFDSTHISWGVATLGIGGESWQVEASAFNGHEPNENRYAPDPIRLDSSSMRLSVNPSRNLSLNASYGYLKSPESTEPGIDQHRLTAAAIWNQPLAHGDNLAFTAAFGRNIIAGKNSDAFLAEATWQVGKNSIFGRWEHVQKDELVGVPVGNYMINKFIVGGIRNLESWKGFDVGLGGYVGFYVFPDVLDTAYGRNPVTVGVFLRIRPGKM
ncbi:MAG TPA: FixH family protein [Fimbriimonadaceae bacterium]|nr:FixH family protein [Fimbriimonadaceae bacterium]